MVAPSRTVRKPLRLIPVPLTDDHPDWLDRDREIPTDHLARQVRFLVEQLDLAELLASYARVGSPATPPDLLLAVALFHLQRKQPSPALWFRNSTESLPVRWLLRGLRPSRRAFYRFADHVPQHLVDVLNNQVLASAIAEGHTTARAGAVDGTLHAAAASRHHTLNRDGLDQRCDQLDARAAEDGPCPPSAPSPAPDPPSTPAAPAVPAPPAPPAPPAAAAPPAPPAPSAGNPATASPAPAPPAKPPRWMGRTRVGRRRQRQKYERARQTLAQRLVGHEKRQKRQRKVKRKGAEKVRIAPCEPEAVLGKDKMKVFRPLYNTQIVQDVDSAFVLGYGVYASVTDAGLLPVMLERTRELTGKELDEVLVDGMYARLLDVRHCVEQGVQMYAPLPAPSQGVAPIKEEGPIGKESFRWLAEEHTYQCPQGHLLQLARRCGEERGEGEKVMVEQYRCAAEHCTGCPLAARCTKRPDKGRTVKRMEGQELLDEVGERTQSEAGKKRYRQRSASVERRHADFKTHRGLDRFGRFGLAAARSVIALAVLVHNGLALLRARAAKNTRFQEANCPP